MSFHQTLPRRRPNLRQRGFTLVELSLVMLVIGLLLGAVAVGRDLQRKAAHQRLSSDFVQGWQLAYEAYLNGVGRPPGDSATSPVGQINGALPGRTVLCGEILLNAFLAAGVQLPQGRAAGQADRYAYLDSKGNPQEVQVCFQNVDWAEPGATVNSFVSRPRNVMVLSGTTYSLVSLLDQQIDGRSDARFGRLREQIAANITTAPTAAGSDQAWSIDERDQYGTTNQRAFDEDQVAVTVAYLQMTR